LVVIGIVARFLLAAGEKPPPEDGPEQDHHPGVGGDVSATALAGDPLVDPVASGGAQHGPGDVADQGPVHVATLLIVSIIPNLRTNRKRVMDRKSVWR
jgi:hypothetical protein